MPIVVLVAGPARSTSLATKLDRDLRCKERSADAISLIIHGPADSDQLGLRYEDAGEAEADKVGKTVSGHVRGEPRIGVVAEPVAGRRAVPEIGSVEGGRLEPTIAPTERGVRACETETDDVGPTVAVHVAETPRILVLARPAAGRCARAERIRHQGGGGEGAIALAERGIGPRKTETDDVGSTVAVHIAENPRILVLAEPAA